MDDRDRCDDKEDCFDGSDEDHCSKLFPFSFFFIAPIMQPDSVVYEYSTHGPK